MKFAISLIVLLLLCTQVFCQKLNVTAPFTGNTMYMEPELHPFIVKISDNEFISLVKNKGGVNGPSDYLLEKYDLNLKVQYSVPVKAGPDEDFIEMTLSGENLIILAVVHEVYRSKTFLKACIFNPLNGTLKQERILDEHDVAKWAEVKYKGAVKESFSDCINSCLNQNYIVPLEYQFKVKHSPDNKKILSYWFDYSQKNLIAKAKIYDSEYDVIAEGIVPIDNNFINYGLYLNNRGDIYILNVDKLGRIVLIQYNLTTRDNKLLDIQYSSSFRENLLLSQLNDDEVYIANTNTNNGILLGITYSKFNFNTNLIDKIYFHEIPSSIKQTVKAARDNNGGGNEDWKHYDLTHFFLNEYEKMIFVLEKREIIGANILHDGTTINTADKGFEKMATINTKGMMFFSFNKNDEVLWESYYDKLQTADVNGGLLAASFEIDNTSEGKLRILYSANEGAMGGLSAIKYLEIDEYKGNILKDVVLENPEKISLIKSHILWYDNKLMFAGRKGLMGKKSFLYLYDLN